MQASTPSTTHHPHGLVAGDVHEATAAVAPAVVIVEPASAFLLRCSSMCVWDALCNSNSNELLFHRAAIPPSMPFTMQATHLSN